MEVVSALIPTFSSTVRSFRSLSLLLVSYERISESRASSFDEFFDTTELEFENSADSPMVDEVMALLQTLLGLLLRSSICNKEIWPFFWGIDAM